MDRGALGVLLQVNGRTFCPTCDEDFTPYEELFAHQTTLDDEGGNRESDVPHRGRRALGTPCSSFRLFVRVNS